jgi:glycerate dehydrogenase
MEDKTVVLNAARMNYDGLLDLSVLSDHLTVYDATDEPDILPRVAGQSIVVTKELPVRGEILSRFPDSVRLICEAGTGYNNIDLAAARAKGIAVCNVPAYSTDRVAHTAIMLMLNLASSMRSQLAMLDRGDRSNFTKYLQVSHVELNGKTLGVVGAGNIGKAVIKIAQAMGMNILVYTRTPRSDGLRYVPLDTLLRESDFVTLHCPLTPDTRHMIDRRALSLMKPTAYLINASRGALIDEPELIAALKSGVIAGAGLDVQETEPPAEGNALYTLENVIMTPHMGWKGLETRQRLIAVLAGNIRGFLAGTPVNVVS